MKICAHGMRERLDCRLCRLEEVLKRRLAALIIATAAAPLIWAFEASGPKEALSQLGK